MRLIKVNAPIGYGEKVTETAFSAGVEKVSRHIVTDHSPGKEGEERDVIDIETSTANAKRFIDALMAEDYYDRSKVGFSTRQPRSLIAQGNEAHMTYPLCEPATDLYEELWQFSHVTYGLIGRIFVSACLLAYGMIESNLLLIIGGLLFLPVLPMVMAICYGLTGRKWNLAGQGLKSIATASVTLFLGGVFVALLSRPPLKFDALGSPIVGILISIAVGLAAQLAAIDDAGRRELIGLAAASQIGFIPVWLGVLTVFGLSASHETEEIAVRVFSFFANLSVLIVAITGTQFITGVVGNIRKLEQGSKSGRFS